MLHSVVLATGALLSGCVAPSADDDLEYSQVESYATVATYVTSSCSTAVVLGLSKQIADEVGCVNPTGLTKFAAGGNLQITSNAVLPYLSAAGAQDLEDVAQGRIVQVNSAFRTVAQQYLLYRWNQLGRCGITAAATPGRSNHESGRALDINNYSVLVGAMATQGWAHDVPGDPVHFDHLSSPDIRGRDVAAFQRLWNKNHADDKIAEDGAYGPATEARLRMAPSEGFPIGPGCVGTRDVDVVAVNGPDRVPPMQRVHYSMTLKNSGTATWAGTTKLRLATATSSMLHDASWPSATVLATLGSAIAPMTSGTVDFDVMTPATDTDLPVFEELTLDDNGTKFGELQLALTVAPGADPNGESGEGSEEVEDVVGGCSAGRNSQGSWLLLLAVAGLRCLGRRRRTA